MKKLLPFFLLLFCASSKAQTTTTITTYYVIPPTSGCNGVWAVQNSGFGACASGVTTYIMNPNGCMTFTGATYSGDTAFLPLCAFPCDLTVMDGNGNVCICGTGTTTGIVNQTAAAVLTTYPNPATTVEGWNVWMHQPGNAVTVSIFNSLGQKVSMQSAENASEIFHVDTSALLPGTYVAEIVVNNSGMLRQKLVITR